MRSTFQPFAYMRFAKTELQGAAYPLCMSGVGDALPDDFGSEASVPIPFENGALVETLETWYGLVAARYGVPAEHVLATIGTSGAVHVALAALCSLDDGHGPIAIETPAYTVFDAVARFLGRDVLLVPRPRDAEHRVDLAAAARAFTAGARVLCLTDLHNPTGAVLADEDLDALRELAARHDTWILLDEVYRDFRPGPVGTAYRRDGRVITVSSLTKCYGVGGPRCGWIVAPPVLRERMESVTEICYGVNPTPSAAMAARGLRNADAILERSRRIAARGLPVIDAWVHETPGLSWRTPDAGITGLVHVEGLTDSLAFARRLRAELGVQVVPGCFFGAEGHIRLSFGLPPAQLQKSLEMLALGIGPLKV